MDEDIKREIKEKISEIEEKSANSDYIYRGEPKRYRKVSSTLYRQYAKEIAAEHFDIEVVQNEMLTEVKRYIHEKDEFEILTQLQHYGGTTNLIDFTIDYLIALFFACDGHHDKHGRVILLEKTEVIKDYIEETQSPINRVRDQKSIFIRPPKGFIEPGQYKRITIPKYLKQPMLDHLEKYHGISTKTIYNDLHGFIKVQNLHQSAYTEFFKGLTCQDRKQYDVAIEHYTAAIDLKLYHTAIFNNRGLAYNNKGNYDHAITDYTKAIDLNPDADVYYNRGLAYNNKGDYDHAITDYTKAIDLNPDADVYYNRGLAYNNKGDYDHAITDYTKAIELKPNNVNAYNNRGNVYGRKGNYDHAITDYTKVIELKPDDSDVYYNRGLAYNGKGDYDHAITDYTKAIELKPDDAEVSYNRSTIWLRLEEWEKAKSDLTAAKEKGANIINEFREDYESITAFEERYNIQLPEDITEMLTPTQS